MKWVKGQSGNPAGRAKGGKTRLTLLRDSLREHVPEILNRLVKSALEGDITAAKLILERTIPAFKSVDSPVAMPSLSGTLSERAEGVLEAVTNGTLTPDEGKGLLASVSNLAKILEYDELLTRVERLESRVKGD